MRNHPKLVKFSAFFLLGIFSIIVAPPKVRANVEIFEKFSIEHCTQTTTHVTKRLVKNCITQQVIRVEVLSSVDQNTSYDIEICNGPIGLCISSDACGPLFQYLETWAPTICE